MMSVVIVLVFMCCITVGLSAEEVSSRRVTIDSEPISKWYFMNKLLVQYGDGEYLTIADVQKLLETLKKNEKDNMTHEKEQFRRSTDSDQTEPSTNVSGTCEARDNWMDDPGCLDNIVSGINHQLFFKRNLNPPFKLLRTFCLCLVMDKSIQFSKWILSTIVVHGCQVFYIKYWYIKSSFWQVFTFNCENIVFF